MEIATLLLERGAQANMANKVGISLSLQCFLARCVFVVFEGCVWDVWVGCVGTCI